MRTFATPSWIPWRARWGRREPAECCPATTRSWRCRLVPCSGSTRSPELGATHVGAGTHGKGQHAPTGRLKDLLNPALRPGHKLRDDLVLRYVDLDRPRSRDSAASYAALTGDARRKARTKAASHVLERIGAIVHRRHVSFITAIVPSRRSSNSPWRLPKMLTDVEDFVRIWTTISTPTGPTECRRLAPRRTS